MRFIDTNVLLYAISADPRSAAKRDVARKLLLEGDVAVSVQVLQEFYAQATRASRPDRLSPERAADFIDSLRYFQIEATTLGLFDSAVATSRRYQISYWDAAIIEAARMAGCAEVLSEDLSDGQSYDGVTVVNPFKP